LAIVLAFGAVVTAAAAADDGAKEIRIGQTLPYSGPVSGFGIIGRAQEAYFEKVNAEGGINGRKIKFITLDDAYSPPKTVEQTRKLVEQEEVLAIVGTIGTPTNSVTQRYLNAKKVPQIFISTGAATSSHQPDQSGGAPAAARHHDHNHAAAILALHPNADRAFRRHQLGAGRSGDFNRRHRPVNRN
jgi:branched-chain amino acid transport system substrate-binding protein